MARGRGGFGGGRRPVCLTGIITASERDDLANLLATITDVVATNMGSIFLDVNATARLARNTLDMSQKENLPPKPPTANRNLNGNLTISLSIANTTNDDDDSSILGELKKEMLAFYRKWQSAIISRTRDLKANDALPSPASSDTQLSGRNRPSKGRGVRNGGPRARANTGASGSFSAGSRTANLSSDSVCAPSMQQIDPSLRRFRPIPTPLWSLPVERRRLLQNIVFLLILSLEEYTAYSRIVMMYLASSLNLPLRSLQEDEVRIGRCLGKISLDFAQGEMARRIADGADIPRGRQSGPNLADDSNFLSGPIANSTLGRCMDGVVLACNAITELLGQLGNNGVTMGSLFAFYGAKATGKTMDAYAKDIQDFALVPTHGKNNKGEPLMDTRHLHPHDFRLRMTICVNGSLMGEDETVVDTWATIGAQAEVYALRWETNSLRSLATCLEMVAESRGWAETRQHFSENSIRDAFVKCKWPSGLERMSKIVDNPWTVGMVRADKVGLVLADIIQRKLQGGRPISLVGYGLGARSIYTCLMALAERRQFGLIDSALLVGCPAPSSSYLWVAMKSVVSGRLINAYSSSDCLLPFLYRLSDTKFGLAGIEAIQGVSLVENHDVGDLPSGYMRYQYMAGAIFQQVGWEDIDHEAVANEAVKLKEFDQKYAPSSIISKPVTTTVHAPITVPQILKQIKSSTLNKGRDSVNGNVPTEFTILPSANSAPLTITTNSHGSFPSIIRSTHGGFGTGFESRNSGNRPSSSGGTHNQSATGNSGSYSRPAWGNRHSPVRGQTEFNNDSRGPRRGGRDVIRGGNRGIRQEGGRESRGENRHRDRDRDIGRDRDRDHEVKDRFRLETPQNSRPRPNESPSRNTKSVTLHRDIENRSRDTGDATRGQSHNSTRIRRRGGGNGSLGWYANDGFDGNNIHDKDGYERTADDLGRQRRFGGGRRRGSGGGGMGRSSLNQN
ncbi:uncharacterized protein BROUX77_007693 [Berkeleyomyces rouxiae]|uniref:uncharacterized protein n=1 Tax=Berkeleyomyces rouxiae TaxID=2035830 RepID=UPI003B7BBC21